MSDRYLLELTAIRSLNDDLRTRLHGGVVSVAEEIKELGPIVHAHALLAMAESEYFDDEEHSSGRFFFCARLFHWWISYGGSPNPASAKLTTRSLFLSI